MKISVDDFEAWKANPITEQFFKAMGVWESQALDAWVAASWERGVIDPKLHADLKARATVLRQLQDVTREQIEDPASEHDA